MNNYLTIDQKNTRVIRATTVFISLFLIAFSFHVANAQTLDTPAPLTQADCIKLKITCPDSASPAAINVRILIFVNALVSFVFILAVLALLYGAFKYIVSTGDEAEAKKTKTIKAKNVTEQIEMSNLIRWILD